ncbi:MAG: hypothetical protein GY729_19470 [Desulfobacteraceae bacterium]|nr:hypothetical protein [Desulfobacteraceae bacterium]
MDKPYNMVGRSTMTLNKQIMPKTIGDWGFLPIPPKSAVGFNLIPTLPEEKRIGFQTFGTSSNVKNLISDLLV